MRCVGVFVFIFTVGFGISNGARILGVFTVNSKSHSIMINAILEELLIRGNEVYTNI